MKGPLNHSTSAATMAAHAIVRPSIRTNGCLLTAGSLLPDSYATGDACAAATEIGRSGRGTTLRNCPAAFASIHAKIAS
jgi:hypothetical protein